jgi:hypothetical protein
VAGVDHDARHGDRYERQTIGFLDGRRVVEFAVAAQARYDSEKYPDQSILVVAFDGYVYLVPCVEDPQGGIRTEIFGL